MIPVVRDRGAMASGVVEAGVGSKRGNKMITGEGVQMETAAV
jgi:hypothetical protein